MAGSKDDNGKRRRYVSQADVPRHSLADALRVPQALADEYGKQPTRPLDVAKAMNLTPTAGPFKMITGAAVAYGLTEGGAQADKIALTSIGRRIVAPTVEGDDIKAKREAFLKPRVIREFLTSYDGSKVPSEAIAKNVLEEMGVPGQFTERTLKVVLEGADSLGLLTEISGKQYVNLDALPETAKTEDTDELEKAEDETDEELVLEEDDLPPDEPPEPEKKRRPNRIFIGHGKQKKPLEQLESTLRNLSIPFKTAVAEPNAGRPIPTKVRQTMQECGAAILIFSADIEYRDKEGNPVWRPSENVSHELGAAAVMYEDRVIIFKEEGVELATNFSSIGYITFEKDKLDAKVNELLKELVAFKILRLSIGDEE